jgi:PHP family Zn ribbon phosphoesterase
MKVFDVKTAKPIEIDPLQPEEKKLYEWRCNRCGQRHKATWKPRIFDMTEHGLTPAECLKDI